MTKSEQADPNATAAPATAAPATAAPATAGSTYTGPEIADAINALTEYLRNGSQTPDPQEFNEEQQDIERDFRALLTGLGRGDRPGRLKHPVLWDKNLELGAALPKEAHEIGGYRRYGEKVWRIKVADATKRPGTATHLRHQAIVADKVVQLRVFDLSGRLILFGFPEAKPKPVSGPTP